VPSRNRNKSPRYPACPAYDRQGIVMVSAHYIPDKVSGIDSDTASSFFSLPGD
jgi:hypothetical protein